MPSFSLDGSPLGAEAIQDQSRRDFFKKVVLASLATGLPPMLLGCEDNSKFRGTGKTPYKIWEEILHYLQTSPDHLAGRMNQLIKERDPKAMFDFVRDEIHLIPLYTKSIGAGDAFKWGLDYVLRSGMATMREKAELLHNMYRSAGIPCSMKIERTNISPQEAKEFFFRPTTRNFAPAVTQKMLRRWVKEMGMENNGYSANATFEDEVGKANSLADKIWENLDLPEDYYFRNFDFRWPNYDTPTVEFQWDERTQYAHLFDPKIPFGEMRSGNPSNIGEAAEIKPNSQSVSLRLTYRDSIDQWEEKDLISGEWLATDLVGRQLNICFLNNLTLEDQAVTPVGNIRIFTPALALQAIGETREFMAERSVLGDPVTLAGKRIDLNVENGTAKIGDAIILEKGNPDLLKKIRSVRISAKTTGYPGVKLSVSPLDSAGNIVERLAASDFAITEDGDPVRCLMENNQRTPRVLILGDTSISMPAEYRNAGMERFVKDLKSRILKKYPAAIIQYWRASSALFTWLLKAARTENDLVIFATDGDNSDQYESKNAAIYRSGPPAIVLNVYDRDDVRIIKIFKKKAMVTNGIHLPARDQTAALAAITKYLDAIEIQPYVFTYNAVGKTNERRVRIHVDDNRVFGSTTYQFAESSTADQIGPRIIGLYLELKVDNQSAVKRVLAGWDHVVRPNDEPSQEMADDVNDLMLGGLQLYFEGAGPTYSAALADLLEAKLSTREWGEALLNNEQEKARKTIQEGQLDISGNALALMAPISLPATDVSLTFPGGLRIGLQTVKPGFVTGTTRTLFDYLPTSQYNTLGNDSREAFKTTLQKTAELAVRENRLFQTSTYGELEDKNWIDLRKARTEKWFSAQTNDDRYWGERVSRGAQLRVFDKSAASRAFWHIAPRTGELYGILPNGSGGGGNSKESDIEAYNRLTSSLLSIISIVQDQLPKGFGGVNAIGAFSLGVVAKYGETLIKLYAIASEAIVIMNASFVDEQVRQALAEFACQVAEDIVSAGTGTNMKTDGLEKLIGMIAPDSYQNPFKCN